MTRIAIVGLLSTLALACTWSTPPSKQASNRPTYPGTTVQEEATKEAAKEHFDRDKVTLKDRVSQQVNLAGANIEALEKLSNLDQGTAKERDDQLKSRLGDLRDHLRNDLDKIDKATLGDWSSLRPLVEADLNAMQGQLRVAEAVTNVPAQRPGVASPQRPVPQPQPTLPLPTPSEGPLR
jgi:hypothetical protein